MSDDDIEVPSAVCLPHMRFTPCRGGKGECKVETEQRYLDLVHRYQNYTGTKNE